MRTDLADLIWVCGWTFTLALLEDCHLLTNLGVSAMYYMLYILYSKSRGLPGSDY